MSFGAEGKYLKKVAIIGASPKEDRYANKAQKMLMEKGHMVFPVSLRGHDVMGVKGYKSVLDIPDNLDTVTLYINPSRFSNIMDEVEKKKPKRVLFNPGTESPEYEKKLQDAGIETKKACTLVLLSTNQF